MFQDPYLPDGVTNADIDKTMEDEDEVEQDDWEDFWMENRVNHNKE